MRIVWDEPKRPANTFNHGLDFAELTEDFFLGAVVGPAQGTRFKAVGRLVPGGRWIAVIFAALGEEAIAIVSMRPASAKERRLFDDEI